MTRMTRITRIARTPREVQEEAAKILDEISDEVGEETLPHGYILKYEGWSPICFPESLPEKEYQDYAQEETEKIIQNEWNPEMKNKSCKYVEGGYTPTGLYGVTWALYKCK